MRTFLIAALMFVIFVPAISHAGDPWRDNHRGGWDDHRGRDWDGDRGHGWHRGHHKHKHKHDRIVYVTPQPIFHAPVFYNPYPVYHGRPHCKRPVYYAPRPTSSFSLNVFGW